MSTFSFNKFGNDEKSSTLGSVNRQNVIQEANKRRTLLKDSSWIKTQPEEDVEKVKDENYGKNILSRYKSQDNLDSRNNQKEDNKPLHNRFKSDDALDRISLRNTSERGNKSATLERFPMSETETTNKSRQSWAPSNNTTMATTPTEESKRKSWGPTSRNTTITTTTTTSDAKQVVPGKPEGQKITIYSSDTRTTDKPTRGNFIDSARSKFEKVEANSPMSPTAKIDTRVQNFEEKPKLPPRSPVLKNDDRASYSTKPAIPESGDRRSAVDRKQRSQDFDNLIDISSSRVISSKGTQDVNNLIDIKPTADKGKKSDPLDNLIEISSTARNASRRDGDLDSMIEIKKPDIKTRTQNVDNLLDIKTTKSSVNKGNLDDLIGITGDGYKGAANATNRSSSTSRTYNITESSQDAPSRRSTTTTYNVTDNSQETPSRRSTTNYKVTDDFQDGVSRRSTSSTAYKVTDDTSIAPTRRSTKTYEDTTDGTNSASNVTISQETRYSPVPDVYASYTDVNKPTSKTYGQNIPSNSIKTVYSTSDRFGIEKDVCTYCRKPLGIDAKMILKDMNICCHATCFKCEACSGSLGNLKAGDSMWIYKQTIHCEPCYFTAREKWII